jgi:ATP-binding cassette subfamily B protein/subfamily B ATP-binding cassette protein MsbA
VSVRRGRDEGDLKVKVLFKLWPYAREYKLTIAFVLFLGFLMSSATVMIPLIVKPLFDEVFTAKDPTNLMRYPFAIILIYAVHGSARFSHLYFLKMTSERVTTKLQAALQQKFMNLSLSYHNNIASGKLISRTLNDIAIIQWSFNLMADIVREPVTGIALLVYVFYMDWKLTLMVMVIAPIIFVLLRQIGKSVRKYSHHQQLSMENLTSTLKETLDGVRIIQSFNLQGEMRNRIKGVIKDYLAARRKIILRQESASPVAEFLAACFFALICYYVGMQIVAGETTVGAFMSYVAALGFLQPPVKKVQDGYIRLQQTAASVERIFAIIDDDDVVPEVSSPAEFPTNWESIEFRNVSFSYGKENVLKNVNLTVKRGEVIALVGESGSGKSTLVNLLERFFDPTEGEILIGGVPIKSLSLFDLRKNVALVTQDVFLFNDTITHNIRSGNFEEESISVDQAAQHANAHNFILKADDGYDTNVGDRGELLSGGEKQRISIARAFYKDAPILILDEATSALDSASEVEVQRGIDQLMKDRTAFVIAHRLSTVAKASRILVMDKGHIVEEGSHQELMAKNGRYSHFQRLQSAPST